MATKPKEKSSQISGPGMVRVTNSCFQGLNIFIHEGNSFESLWLEPKSSVVIKESQITEIVSNLIKRKMLSVSKV